MSPPRRVAAIVLPRLASELARERPPSPFVAEAQRPLAVVLTELSLEESTGAAIVSAVDDAAEAAGIRPGMRVSEAMARSAHLTFATLAPSAVASALVGVAEVAMSFGAIVEIDGTDTVWVDVTGVAHLFGGEFTLREEIEARVAALGYRVDVAIADGPFFARALARFGPSARAGIHADVPRVAPIGGGKAAVARLPVAALGLGPECVAFFARLGVFMISDLMRIERAQLVSRLGPFVQPPHDVKEVLGWLDGRDTRPLVPFDPPEVLVDQATFEDGVEAAPQLVFAVRALVSRLSSRLTGRRQATNRIDVTLHYDRSIFALRTEDPTVSAEERSSARARREPLEALGIDLPAPLSHTDDLFRAVKAKVENLVFAAPAIRLEIRLTRIVHAPEIQLDLSRDVSVSPDALPALLSELSAEIGSENVGVLTVVDDHRPERRSALVGIQEASAQRAHLSPKKQLALFAADKTEAPEPSRLLNEPVAVGCTVDGGRRLAALAPGSTLFIGADAFTVEAIDFDRRLEAVAWWTSRASSRDYLRVTLSFPSSGTGGAAVPRGSAAYTASGALVEAWMFVDRRTGDVFLQGFWE